jgi:hypothetical protein
VVSVREKSDSSEKKKKTGDPSAFHFAREENPGKPEHNPVAPNHGPHLCAATRRTLRAAGHDSLCDRPAYSHCPDLQDPQSSCLLPLPRPARSLRVAGHGYLRGRLFFLPSACGPREGVHKGWQRAWRSIARGSRISLIGSSMMDELLASTEISVDEQKKNTRRRRAGCGRNCEQAAQSRQVGGV